MCCGMLQWLTAREDYHRLLKQIRLTGVRNGTNISHYYNYVNFRAVPQAPAVFDHCLVAPMVSFPCCPECMVAQPLWRRVCAALDDISILSICLLCSHCHESVQELQLDMVDMVSVSFSSS